MVQIVSGGDLCALAGVILILITLGKVYAGERQRWWGGVLALCGFLAFAGYLLWAHPPRTAEDLFHVALRSLVLFGLVLGLSWVLLPVLGAVFRGLFRSLTFGLGASHAGPVTVRHEPPQETAPAEATPEEKAAAEALAKTNRVAHKRREDARAGVQILFSLHRHELGERFPKEDFDYFVTQYMGDEREAGYVEERAKQLRELILEHVGRLKPADPDTPAQREKARAEVQACYDEHPEIHAVFPRRRLQAELRVRIPDTVSSPEAWKEARELMNEILKLSADEKEKQCPKAGPMINPPLENV